MKRSNSGSTFVGVLMTMVVVSSMIAVVFNVTNQNTRLSKRNADRAQAIAYADGVLESLFDQWRLAMISVTDTTDRAQGLANSALQSTLAVPTNTQLPPPANISLVSWSVTAATPMLVPLTGSTARPTAENGTKSSLLVRLNYLATVQVRFSAQGNNNTVTLQRNFVRGGRNLFDNFLFSTQPITEIHPGAPMYVSGNVYAGGDLYTAHNDLHFVKDVPFTGTHTLNYRTADSRFGTAPSITTGGLGDNWNTTYPPHLGREQKLLDVAFTSLDPNFTDDPLSNDTDSTSNPNDNGFQEIIDEVNSSYSDVLQLDTSISERLVKTADYRIYVNSTNTVSIYKGTSTTALVTTGAEYLAIKNAITTNTALWDQRQADNVRLVILDVGAITTAYTAGTITDNTNGSDGLAFYMKDTSVGTSVSTKLGTTSTTVTSTKNRALKLTNGAKLPYNPTAVTGFTVISSNPVYIQGDYNTGTVGSTKPPSNTATSYTPPTDNPSPVVAGYTRAPAAVICDAINVLSNSWTDANSTSSGSGSGPTASNTTINVAIMAGTVPTTTSSYSGGIENFPRLHEDWGGKYFTIYGSMAPLFNSVEAKGTWSSARYGAPNRRWYYDTVLRENNPPGFHIARTYERGRRIIR